MSPQDGLSFCEIHRTKNTIVDFEKGRSTPVTNNLAAIQRVLEQAGVEFTNGDAPGLRLRKKKR